MENPVILQTFYWEMNSNKYAEDFPEEKDLWSLIDQRADSIAEAGFDYLWFPPANKGAGGIEDVGYGTYDLWDLGEFKQKGNKRTKYGTKEQLEKVVNNLHSKGLKVIYDAVLNHRLGADDKETVTLKDGSQAEVWTKFDFPGRGNKYSNLKLNWSHFDGVDWNERTRRAGEFLFQCKEWDDSYEDDYLMGADIDYDNQEIKAEVINWGKWIINQMDFDGFRLDASTHIDNEMIHDFIEEVTADTEKNLIFIGEAWVNSPKSLMDYLNIVDNKKLCVFDFPLRQSFVEMMKGNLDMRWYGGRGLVNQKDYKNRAVTFVENHDTDHESTNKYGIETIVYRKMQAYTYIMMRRDGIPTVFWKDYYNYGLKDKIDKLISARKKFAYGDAFESETNDQKTYSYIRTGDEKHPGSGLVMMITQREKTVLIEKAINTGKANTYYYDFTNNVTEKVKTDSNGNGNFKVRGTAGEGYSIWVQVEKQ
ncbi:alpha-amylase [Halanaerobium saccharolyticum]|uniref:Alpha-amylase n=1 Tax=Halanaerobium saccharolyticum TaxID=43595 RepID=A0A4R7YSV9_9FIRM|nr:alpha-amylase family glycosyl hydrolase [Halanaerobium saccharolyticum]RAK06361.1 alpha-amylase [Halanaerobium saccharolyticum]TDW00673.1 alpha-amylase [Halanaerobium saccharolyticum]TDX52286.1 alpha-amylase [Halanaerobium saccharolyticum]